MALITRSSGVFRSEPTSCEACNGSLAGGSYKSDGDTVCYSCYQRYEADED